MAVAMEVWKVMGQTHTRVDRYQHAGVLFYPVAIVRVPITAIIGTLVYGTNTLRV